MESNSNNTSVISLEDKLKRCLYLDNYVSLYVTGNSEKHININKNKFVIEYAKQSPQQFIEILKAANDDELLPRRYTIFYNLALIINSFESKNSSGKSYFIDQVLPLCKNDDDFFQFIKYFTKMNPKKHKISKPIGKLIRIFYLTKSPEELAETLRKRSKYYGWSHKDLFKLSHIATKNMNYDFLIKYTMYGEKGVEKFDSSTDEFRKLFKKTHELRTTNSPEKAVKLINELNDTNFISQTLVKSAEVWTVIISKLTTREILNSLTKYAKLGLFSCPASKEIIVRILTDPEKIAECKLHPLEVFIYFRNFDYGKIIEHKAFKILIPLEGRNVDATIPVYKPRDRKIVNSIMECLKISYKNIKPLGRKIMITIDATNSNTYCMHNRCISTFEAAFSIVKYFSKIEKNLIVGVYDIDKVKIIDFTKYNKTEDFNNQLKDSTGTYVLPKASFEWAINEKKQIDLFISILSHDYIIKIPKEEKKKLEKPTSSLFKYQKTMTLTDVKLVRIFLDGLIPFSSDKTHNILNICGFTEELPKVLEAFCYNKFI